MLAVLAARQLLHQRQWQFGSSCGLLRTFAVPRDISLPATSSSVLEGSCGAPYQGVAGMVPHAPGAQLLGAPANTTTVRRTWSSHRPLWRLHSSSPSASLADSAGRTSSSTQRVSLNAGRAAQPGRVRALSTACGGTFPGGAEGATAAPAALQHIMEGSGQQQEHPQPRQQQQEHPQQQHPQPGEQQRLQPQLLPDEVLLIGIDPDTQGAIAVVRSRLLWRSNTPQNGSSSSSTPTTNPGDKPAGAPAATSRSRRRNTKSSSSGDSNASNSSSSSSSTAEVPQPQAYMALPPAAVRVYDMPVETIVTHSKTSTGRARKRRRLDILQAMSLIRQVLQDTAETAGAGPAATALDCKQQQQQQRGAASSTTSNSSSSLTADHSSIGSSNGVTASAASSNGSTGDPYASSDNTPATADNGADTTSTTSSSSSSRHGRILLRAVLEVASIRPANGSLATINTGYSLGAWTALLSSHGFDVTTIHVRGWKKDMGLLRQDKDSSRQLAKQLFDQAGASQEPLLRTKNTHGRAEALLLAAWGLGWSVDKGDRASLAQGPVRATVQMDTGMHVLPLQQQQQQQQLAVQQSLFKQQQHLWQQQQDRADLTLQRSPGAADNSAPAPPPAAHTEPAAVTPSDNDDAAAVAGSDDEAGIEDLLCSTGSSSSSRGTATLLGVPYSLLASDHNPLWALPQQQQPRVLDVGSQMAAAAAAAEAKVAAEQAGKEKRAADRAAAAAARAAAKEEEKRQRQAARAAAAQERAERKAQETAAKAAAAAAAAQERAERKAQETAAKAAAAAAAAAQERADRKAQETAAKVAASAAARGRTERKAQETAAKAAAAAAAETANSSETAGATSSSGRGRRRRQPPV